MKRRLRAPSPALVISLIALFVALGGTSYAAINALPKNSVGSKQLKNGAVTKTKISKTTLGQLKGNTGPAGTPGAQGIQGIQGVQGPAGPFPATLPAGKTVVGTYDMEGTAAAANGLVTSQISYLYSAPSQTVNFVATGTSSANCPGTAGSPSAKPGFTCIYEIGAINAAAAPSGRGLNFNEASGPGLFLFSAGAGQFSSWGTWAATAPLGAAVHATYHAPVTLSR